MRVVGGCCGTRPEHIRKLAEKIPAAVPPLTQREQAEYWRRRCRLSRLSRNRLPFLIGERLNAQGSRAFKKLLLAEDYDGMLQIARDQLETGAHGLDVSVAVTERSDEAH